METIKETIQNDSCCPDLSAKTRAIGFTFSFILGIIFLSLACFYISGVFLTSINSFVVFYSLGVLFLVVSSFFFKGPKVQWQTMTHATRIVPTVIFIIALVFTFVSVYLIGSWILTVISVAVQMSAALFYLLTFIQGGTKCFKTCCKSLFCCGKNDEENSGNKETIL